MADDPSAAGDPEAGRSDLFARIQDLQDDVDSGLSTAQVQEAVRGAVAALLPGLVSDAVSSALTGALPVVTEYQPAPDMDGVEARLAALEDALDGVGDRFEALTRDQASTTAAAFADLRTQIGAIGDPAGFPATSGGRREEVDALREDLADALDYVRTTLATELGARAAETQAAVRALSGSLDAVRPQDAQLILDRLDALPYQLPAPDLSPVHDQLAALAAAEPAVDVELLLTRLDAIERALSGTDLDPVHRRLDDLAARLTAGPTDAEDLEALHVRFDSLLAAVDTAAEGARDRQVVEIERLRAAIAEQLTAAEAPASRVLSELDGLRATVADAALLSQAVDDRVARIATAASEQLLEVRTDLATTAGETLSVLADIRDRPQVDVSDRLDALAEDVGRLADAPAPADHGDRLEALSDGLAGVDGRVEGLRARLDGLDDRIEALRSDLGDAVERGRTALADQLTAAQDEIRAGMADHAAARQVDVEADRESQEATIARLDRIADHPLLSGEVDLGSELGVQLDTMRAQLREAVDGLPPQIDAWRTETAEDRARLAAALSGLEGAREEMTALVEHIGDQGAAAAATLRAASLAALEQLRSDSGAAAADVRRDVDAARARLDEQADAARQGVLDDVRTAASAALDDVRAAITGQEQATSAATSEMQQIAHRVQSAGRLVVAYLSERDVALEEVRDRDTIQLLEDVLSTLSRKDREKTAGETRGILARRRDGRHAERWRDHQQNSGKPEAHVDVDADADADVNLDDESLLELLDGLAPDPQPGPAAAAPAELADAPEPAVTEESVQEVSEPALTELPATQESSAAAPSPTPAKKAPAKKTPAKKAPARKAPARNAPARKAPAKQAPARKAPARKAPAKQAPARKAPATPAAPAPAASEPPTGAPETPPG